MKRGKDSIYCRYIKRILDILCSLAAMIMFCWLYAIIAVLVRVKLGCPVVYASKRLGKEGKPYTLYKFRSMTDACDLNGNLLPDEQRVTYFGRLLRSFSLDELPEAWNILFGDMSIIGPRPLPAEYMKYYSEEEKHRHDVKPGLSGLAQVNGRNNLRWEEKFAFDTKYVRTCSFMMDVSIVLQTIRNVICRKDVVTGDTVVIGDYISRPLNIERSEAIDVK